MILAADLRLFYPQLKFTNEELNENDYENKNDNNSIDAGGIIDLVSTITSAI